MGNELPMLQDLSSPQCDLISGLCRIVILLFLLNSRVFAVLIDALTTALPLGLSIWIEFMTLPVRGSTRESAFRRSLSMKKSPS